jgi:2'-5' RNA ligase
LAFIGEVDEGRTAAARAVVEGLPRDSGGDAWLDGILLLPNARRARVVALGVVDEAAVFSELFGLVMGGLEANGVTTREKRPYRAHLTIARMRRPGSIEPTHDCGRERFGVESVCLYESKLRREGAEYTVVARTELKMAEGQETT